MANEILAENIAFDENGLYIPQTWLDGVGEGNYTPISADRMNHIEQGIKGLSDAWDSQSQMLDRIKIGERVTKIEFIGLSDSSFIRIWNSNGHFYDLTASYIG